MCTPVSQAPPDWAEGYTCPCWDCPARNLLWSPWLAWLAAEGCSICRMPYAICPGAPVLLGTPDGSWGIGCEKPWEKPAPRGVGGTENCQCG